MSFVANRWGIDGGMCRQLSKPWNSDRNANERLFSEHMSESS